LYGFEVLILKIIFKIKIYYFKILFKNKKKRHPIGDLQTIPNMISPFLYKLQCQLLYLPKMVEPQETK
jgi:hypothetical protein